MMPGPGCFHPQGRNGDSQNCFRVQGSWWPRSLSVTLRRASHVATSAVGLPSLQDSLTPGHFYKFLLCLRIHFSVWGFPPVWASMKQIGSSTTDHFGITIPVMNIDWRIKAQSGISTRVLGRSCCAPRGSWQLLGFMFFRPPLAVGTLLHFLLTSLILVQCCALFIITMSYDNDNLEAHWFKF